MLRATIVGAAGRHEQLEIKRKTEISHRPSLICLKYCREASSVLAQNYKWLDALMATSALHQPVLGFFLQDDPETEDEFAAAILPRFGLNEDGDDRWVKFKEEVEQLSENAPYGTKYKVIFLGRHGQGYHNVAIAKYPTEEWRSKWARLTGDGELVWGPDPELTELGIEQARDVNRAWRTELEYNIPLPERLYTSPMRRAIKTHQISFEGHLRPDLKTTIVDDIREHNGVATNDKRRTKSEIAKDFPDYSFEEGFTEEDDSWDPDIRETYEELDARAKRVLDMVFDDDARFISITSHHGFADAFLRVCKHRPWYLPTGGVIPILLKAEQQQLN